MELYNADCLEKMKEISDGSIDAVICDPPYGTTACKWDSIIPFEPMWEQLKRITKKNGAIVLFGSQPFTSALVMSNPKMFKYEWTWKKNYPTGNAFAKYQPMRVIEQILVFSQQGKMIYNPQMRECADSVKKRWKEGEMESEGLATYHSEHTGMDSKRHPRRHNVYPINYLDIKCENRAFGTLHPTQKPVTLMEYLIKTHTNEGETVLDFTMGSGTTGVACKSLNRNFVGIELDENYFNIAKKRIELSTLFNLTDKNN